MKIGYARVSTDEQNLDLQMDALEAVGCDRIYCDEGISGSSITRPGFKKALRVLKAGDVLVVWKMDRAFRSLRHALDTLEKLELKGVEFKELTEGIDTTTAMGKCFYQIRNAFAELEWNLISERTKAGMAAAKARGVHVGRPRKLNSLQVEEARQKIISGDMTLGKLAQQYEVDSSTLSRALKEVD